MENVGLGQRLRHRRSLPAPPCPPTQHSFPHLFTFYVCWIVQVVVTKDALQLSLDKAGVAISPSGSAATTTSVKIVAETSQATPLVLDVTARNDLMTAVAVAAGVAVSDLTLIVATVPSTTAPSTAPSTKATADTDAPTTPAAAPVAPPVVAAPVAAAAPGSSNEASDDDGSMSSTVLSVLGGVVGAAAAALLGFCCRWQQTRKRTAQVANFMNGSSISPPVAQVVVSEAAIAPERSAPVPVPVPVRSHLLKPCTRRWLHLKNYGTVHSCISIRSNMCVCDATCDGTKY